MTQRPLTDTQKVRALHVFTHEMLVAFDAAADVAEKLLSRGYTFAVTKVPAGHFQFHLSTPGAMLITEMFGLAPYELVDSDREEPNIE